MKNYSNDEIKFVFADSSFYICLIGELNQPNCYNLLDYYSFALGSKVETEIKKHLSKNIYNKINICPNEHYNYTSLIAPLLTNEEKDKNKGEYEIIGLSYFYLNQNKVKYIIIDDKAARNFLNDHFKELSPYLTGTIGIFKYCVKDEFISSDTAINILVDIKNVIKNYDESPGNFICNLGKKNYEKIINKTIHELKEGKNG